MHLLAGLLVLAAVIVNVARPVAPSLADIPDPSRWFDHAHLARVEAYRRPLQLAAAVGLVVRLALPLLVAFSSVGRRLVDRVVDRMGERRPRLAAVAVVVGVLVATDVVLLPLAFWAGYVHEGVFGFRTQGLAGWSYDWVVGRAPGWLAAAVLVALGLTLARRLPRAWPPVAGFVGMALTALVVFAGPLVLEPLHHRMSPLEPGAVRSQIEEVLTASGTRVERILVADASRRTTRANAYVSGLVGSRRVVLYDNLIRDFPPEEVGMVMAHEMGHHLHGDLPRGVALAGAGIVLAAYALDGVLRSRVRDGRQRSVTDPRGVAVALAVVAVLNAVSMPVQMALSRRAEAAADLAALDLTEDPATYMEMTLRLGRSSLSDPDPPSWAYALWYTHPTVAERVTMGERWPLGDRSDARR